MIKQKKYKKKVLFNSFNDNLCLVIFEFQKPLVWCHKFQETFREGCF